MSVATDIVSHSGWVKPFIPHHLDHFLVQLKLISTYKDAVYGVFCVALGEKFTFLDVVDLPPPFGVCVEDAFQNLDRS